MKRPAIVLVGVALLATSAASGAERPRTYVAFAQLVSPSFGVADVSSGSREHVLVDSHGTWSDRTPRHLEYGVDLFFLNRRDGWLATNNCAKDAGVVYRTHDSGRSWSRVSVDGVNCAEFSTLELAF